MRNLENKARMEKWRVQSSADWGFHEVITPNKCECKETQIYRLNLKAGTSFVLESKSSEMNAVLLEGSASLLENAVLDYKMIQFDSFYIKGNESVTIKADEDCFFYIAGAKCEGYGKTMFRKFDITLPIGDIHQIHGSGAGQREVMFTCAPQDEASRLLCGLTWGGDGGWTSWPPHEHAEHLEEVYCYFAIPAPKFGFHVSYLKSGEVEDIVTHTVQTGTCVEAPCGYHPTVAMPGSRNAYFWALGALRHESRRYDLAELDKNYANK